jgi:hypothetical protein
MMFLEWRIFSISVFTKLVYNWYDSSTSNDSFWPNATDSIAVFGSGGNSTITTGGAVTVATGGVQANAITFNITGYSLSGSLTATSIVQDTLTIDSGTGDTLNIAAFDGGSTSGSSLTQVPEPSTWAMFMLAAMGPGIYRHRNMLGPKNLNFSGR